MLYSLVVAALFTVSLSLVIDRPDTIVQGWTELQRTDPNKSIKLTFAVRNQNVECMNINTKYFCYYLFCDPQKQNYNNYIHAYNYNFT